MHLCQCFDYEGGPLVTSGEKCGNCAAKVGKMGYDINALDGST